MQAVFFDLDGTLLDTVHDIHAAVTGAQAELGYPVFTLAETMAAIGNGARTLIERATPQGGDTEALFRAYQDRYGRGQGELTRPFAGISELLGSLSVRGIKLAVVSNKPKEAVENVIGRFFPATFDFLGGDDGLFPLKPDPSLVRYAAFTLRVPIGQCVMVGDGETDVETARRAGMAEVAVLWGYRSREALAKAGATRFASTPAELEKILENLS